MVSVQLEMGKNGVSQLQKKRVINGTRLLSL